MPSRTWSIALEGDPYGLRLFTDRAGRVVVSTTRRVESDRPSGIDRPRAEEPRPATTYVNYHALRCYAIAADGRVEWIADEVNAVCEAPDGRLVATNDRHEFLVLDRTGALVETRPVADGWSVIGWVGADPVVSSTDGAVWVAPRVYALRDRHLYVHDAAGQLLSKTPIDHGRFEAICRERPELAGWPTAIRSPHRFELAYHAPTQRLIASHASLLAWTMSLGLDGTVDWVTLTGDGCCNGVCLLGTVIAHASSCGQRLSFLALGGQVLCAHHLDELSYCFPDGTDGVCAKTSHSVQGFAATGELRWSVDVPDLRAATTHGGVLYTLAGESRIELSAFSLA